MFAEGSEASKGAKSFVSVADKFVEEIQLSIKSSSVFGERDCSISSSGCLKNEESESVSKLTGHYLKVYDTCFSPDGKWIASTGSDRGVRIWDVRTGLCDHVLNNDLVPSETARFSPDGKHLVSSENRKVRVWNVATRQLIHELEGHSKAVNGACFSSDGKQLASCSLDKTVRLWNASTGQCTDTLEGHSDFVESVHFSPDNLRLASASFDKTVRVWNIRNVAADSDQQKRKAEKPLGEDTTKKVVKAN